MERSFEEVHRALGQAHSREIKELKDKTDSWRERFEKLKAQKQKCQEEYHAQRDENRGLCKEVANLLDTISKLQSREVSVKCSMCETLQKSLDTLRQSYSDSLAEKDRIISILDTRLTEISSGESLLPMIKLKYSTPSKQDGGKTGSGSICLPSNRKQSPDSTIETTPRKDEDTISGNSDTSVQEQAKGTKLCLSRGQKRHRYTESISPNKKRQKITEKRNIPPERNKEQILVPETCDLYSQSDVSSGSERISSDNSLQSPVVYRNKDQREQGDKINDVCATDFQIIPETAHFYDAYSSSSEEEEVDDVCTQSTIKRAPNQNYSLRSILCSPPSSDGEDCITDMRNIVNHQTMQLSGQSVVTEDKTQKNVKKSAGTCIDVRTSNESQVSGRCLNQNSSLTSKMSQLEQDNDMCDKVQIHDKLSKQNDTLSVKPFNKGSSQQTRGKHGIRTSSDEERKTTRISRTTNQQTSSQTFHGSLSSLSPVTKIGGVQYGRIGSPSLLQVSRTEVGEEPESPSLLKGASLVDNDITVLDSPESGLQEKNYKKVNEISNKSQEKISGRSFKKKLQEVEEDKSPCLLRSKTRINIKGSNMSDSSVQNSKFPKTKILKLSKGSKVVLVNSNDNTLSSRQLRQTTLSQVFNNSPPKRKKKKTGSQEEEDLQKAIQLSLRDVELQSRHKDSGDVTEESVKENTSPFKKPVIPTKKPRNRHPSNESPLKNARSTGKDSSVMKGQKSPSKGSTILQAQRSPGKDPSVPCGEKSNVVDLDDTMSPDSVRLDKPSRCKTDLDNRTLSSNDSECTLSRNGSMDPNIHLSVLCDEQSELILESHEIPTRKKLSFHEQGDVRIKESSFMEFDIGEVHFPSLDDSVATLKDFRIDDLEQAENGPESGHLTSTCIDEDSQSIACSSRSVKFGSRKKRVIVTTGYNSEDEKEDGNLAEELENMEELDDSFDKLPDKAATKYAYVGVVRKQNERRNLIGYECKECYEYYSAMGLSEEEVRQRVQTCSKHRAHYVPPETPPHFWSVGFPDTQECEERGYLNKEEDMDERDIRPAFRRRRKLKKIFKSKNESEEEKESDLQR